MPEIISGYEAENKPCCSNRAPECTADLLAVQWRIFSPQSPPKPDTDDTLMMEPFVFMR